MNQEKKATLIKTIEIRLEGVRESSRRGRFAFLVMIIASGAMSVVLWNAHFSWNRWSTFPSDMANKSEMPQIYNNFKDKPCIDDNFANETPEERNKNCIGGALPLYEYNRRNLSAEWLKSTNISIGLLGVTINSNDLNTLGVITLLLITIWLAFSVRRENRTIVALLRDINLETNFTNDNVYKYEDEWDIANLAYQGISNNLVFINASNDDLPMTVDKIFKDYLRKTNDNVTKYSLINWFLNIKRGISNYIDKHRNNITQTVTRTFLRKAFTFLLYLPPLLIACISLADFKSLGLNTAFAEGFKQIMNPDNEIAIYHRLYFPWFISAICLICTLANCFVITTLNNITSEAIVEFGERLKSKEPREKIITSVNNTLPEKIIENKQKTQRKLRTKINKS